MTVMLGIDVHDETRPPALVGGLVVQRYSRCLANDIKHLARVQYLYPTLYPTSTDESPFLPGKPIAPGVGVWNGSHARSRICRYPRTAFTGFIRSRP